MSTERAVSHSPRTFFSEWPGGVKGRVSFKKEQNLSLAVISFPNEQRVGLKGEFSVWEAHLSLFARQSAAPFLRNGSRQPGSSPNANTRRVARVQVGDTRAPPPPCVRGRGVRR